MRETPLRRPAPASLFARITPGSVVLLVFAGISVLFGAFTVYRYREQLEAAQDIALFVSWLFLTMVGGMFVQVITTNYRDGKPLFDVSASQLIFPLLFSVIVFYPIWAIASQATDSAFAVYAAFLNGFFWQTVVKNG